MGSFSIWHWMIVLAVVLLLFGSGKISGLMGDVAKGIKSFKANIKDDEAAPDASMRAESAPPAGTIAGPQQTTSQAHPTASTTTTGRPAA